MFDLQKILTSRVFDEPFIIVSRHAQKFIDEEPTRYDCEITQEGIMQSNHLGELLRNMPFEINTIKTSPVPRCVKTAKILQEKTKCANFEESFLLGHPGVYIEDASLAGKIFEERSVYDIVCDYISGHSFLGFRHVEEGNRLLLQEMLSDLRLRKNSIYVSHDVILTCFVGSLLKLTMNQNFWIDYLQGFVITLSNDSSISLHLENKEYNIYA